LPNPEGMMHHASTHNMSHERERTLRHGGHSEAQEGSGDVENLQKKKKPKEFLNLIDYKFISVFTQPGPAN
jgi:hypothetical protein